VAAVRTGSGLGTFVVDKVTRVTRVTRAAGRGTSFRATGPMATSPVPDAVRDPMRVVTARSGTDRQDASARSNSSR